MNCDGFDALASRERLTDEEDALLGRHLAACSRCASRETLDAQLADPLVEARGALLGLRSAARRAGSFAVAGSLLLAAALALRTAGRETDARQPATWTIRGDSTGVSLTGPGVSRRGETLLPPRSPKGGRT